MWHYHYGRITCKIIYRKQLVYEQPSGKGLSNSTFNFNEERCKTKNKKKY